ncbi:AI-2E family transporter [Crocinitomix catalasitica]|uniref:AI-2E family transporter n=1 Tax=Crocinitomix catalasitica TaxID=184607 RepID=UPI0006841FA1|nr:AI-2E family transporter [Crocinitomix catalasitica]
MKIKSTALTLFVIIAVVYILIIGQNIIVPLILAFLFWFLIKELRNFAKRIKFIKNRVPSWLLNSATVIVLYFIIAFVSHFLIINIQELSSNMDSYQSNLNLFNQQFSDRFGYDLMSQSQGALGDFDFTKILGAIINSFTDILGNIFMIGLYLLFMLLEETVFEQKMQAVFANVSNKREIRSAITKIDTAVGDYIVLKTIVSLITGTLSFIGLRIIGVDSPLFWAFLIFVLNFIPTIGSLIGTIFPAIIAVLQFGDLNMGLVVLAVIGGIQLVVGNIVEPKLMGNSLNISSLVVILSLSLWGAIWGILGMILSVPITVILIILFAQFPSTKNIAIILSEKGKIE